MYRNSVKNVFSKCICDSYQIYGTYIRVYPPVVPLQEAKDNRPRLLKELSLLKDPKMIAF